MATLLDFVNEGGELSYCHLRLHDAAAIALADPVMLRPVITLPWQDVAARPVRRDAGDGTILLTAVARTVVLRPAAIRGVAAVRAAILLAVGAAAACILLLGSIGAALLVLRWESSGRPMHGRGARWVAHDDKHEVLHVSNPELHRVTRRDAGFKSAASPGKFVRPSEGRARCQRAFEKVQCRRRRRKI